MDVIFYALRDGFYAYAKQHPNILSHVAKLSLEQQTHILQTINEQVLCERAIQYFDCQDIYVKDHMLHYKNTMCATTFTIQLNAYSIVVHDHEKNPFLPFLKRIFRSFVSVQKKEVIETYEKCCKNAKNIVK